MGQQFYTYVWRRADGTPFYVGKGKGNRAWSFAARSREFEIEISRGGCSVDIAQEFDLEADALAHEVALIAQYGRRESGGHLVNLTAGGAGVIGTGDATKAKRRATIRKRRGFRGKIKTKRGWAGMVDPALISRLHDARRLAGPGVTNKSGFKGVSLQAPGQWVAKIDGRYLGLFGAPEAAARAYDDAARKAWGDKCYLNFPPSKDSLAA